MYQLYLDDIAYYQPWVNTRDNDAGCAVFAVEFSIRETLDSRPIATFFIEAKPNTSTDHFIDFRDLTSEIGPCRVEFFDRDEEYAAEIDAVTKRFTAPVMRAILEGLCDYEDMYQLGLLDELIAERYDLHAALLRWNGFIPGPDGEWEKSFYQPFDLSEYEGIYEEED